MPKLASSLSLEVFTFSDLHQSGVHLQQKQQAERPVELRGICAVSCSSSNSKCDTHALVSKTLAAKLVSGRDGSPLKEKGNKKAPEAAAQKPKTPELRMVTKNILKDLGLSQTQANNFPMYQSAHYAAITNFQIACLHFDLPLKWGLQQITAFLIYTNVKYYTVSYLDKQWATLKNLA